MLKMLFRHKDLCWGEALGVRNCVYRPLLVVLRGGMT